MDSKMLLSIQGQIQPQQSLHRGVDACLGWQSCTQATQCLAVHWYAFNSRFSGWQTKLLGQRFEDPFTMGLPLPPFPHSLCFQLPVTPDLNNNLISSTVWQHIRMNVSRKEKSVHSISPTLLPVQDTLWAGTSYAQLLGCWKTVL